jgi:hypothetical protein
MSSANSSFTTTVPAPAATSYANATTVPTLPTTVTQGQTLIRSSDRSVWVGRSGAWRLLAIDTDVPTLINANRGFIYNGSCTLPSAADSAGIQRVPGWGNAVTNMAGAIVSADRVIRRYGSYSMKLTTTPSATLTSDYFFAITAGVVYGMFLSFRTDVSTTNVIYPLLHCIGYEGQLIGANNHTMRSGTNTYLSRDFKSGDTKAYLHQFRDAPGTTQPVSAWQPPVALTTPHLWLGIFNDRTADGFVYPSWVNATTTQPLFTRSLFKYSAVAVIGNEIELTMQSAYTGATITAGTPVGNMMDGGYLYLWGSRGYGAAGQWVDLTPNATIVNNGAFSVAGSSTVMAIRPYTARVQPGIILNYSNPSNGLVLTTNFHMDIHRIG